MRWFWLFILGLVVLTGTLYTLRVRAQRVVTPVAQPIEDRSASARRTRPPRIEEPIVEHTAPSKQEQEEIVQHEEVEAEVTQSVDKVLLPELIVIAEPEPLVIDEEIAEADEESDVKTDEVTDEEAVSSPIVELVIEESPSDVEESAAVGKEASSQDEVVDEPLAQEEPTIEAQPAPTYELQADGTLKIFATDTVISGSGTQADPFVLDWVTLRAIERVFNPKKGINELPLWLDLLNERHVRIKGNTLVPVIATTTRELLVMQNPWDGCCVGIPPSPYDAIEVTLNHDVDFGSSAVGYGTVEGIFYLDPYVVDGWVLGIYLIEDASYRSGDGIVFPDF